MGKMLTTGTVLKCSFGNATSPLKGTSALSVIVDGKPAVTIADVGGTVNISPFGMCSSLANPQVAAATAAALGVLTPQPCIPQPVAWKPSGAAVFAKNQLCLTDSCTCKCAYAGEITVVKPGQKKVIIKE